MGSSVDAYLAYGWVLEDSDGDWVFPEMASWFDDDDDPDVEEMFKNRILPTLGFTEPQPPYYYNNNERNNEWVEWVNRKIEALKGANFEIRCHGYIESGETSNILSVRSIENYYGPLVFTLPTPLETTGLRTKAFHLLDRLGIVTSIEPSWILGWNYG